MPWIVDTQSCMCTNTERAWGDIISPAPILVRVCCFRACLCLTALINKHVAHMQNTGHCYTLGHELANIPTTNTAVLFLAYYVHTCVCMSFLGIYEI